MKQQLNLILIILLALSLTAAVFFGLQSYNLGKYSVALQQEFSVVKEELSSTIDSLSEDLSKTETERDDFEIKYNNEKTRVDFLASQILSIEGTIGLLEKLNETDPELLQKYSKVYFLNENYIPESLTPINEEHTLNSGKEYLFHTKVWPFLKDLLSDAADSGIDIKIASAYRSFGAQSQLKSNYKIIYGSGANQFSADQGYSEHQLGTTVDFTTTEIGNTFSDFEKTETYQWLQDNAHKYGFVISYPEDNSYYQFEPWHWRFVGRSLAEGLYKESQYFYDLDQREINKYLLFFFD